MVAPRFFCRSALAVACALLVASPTLWAHSRPGTTHRIIRVRAHATLLGKIVVEGNHLPLPIALEILKTALRSPWDTSWKDRNKIVCRTRGLLDTRIWDRRILFCETNQDFFQALYALHTGLETGGPIPVMEDVNQPEAVRVTRFGLLQRLLAKVPPAGSSYTLEVTSHGKVISKWVMKKGELVKAWHLAPAAGVRPDRRAHTHPHLPPTPRGG